MAFRTATSSDYAELLKSRNKNQQGISMWEEYFLQPVQSSFETAGKQISAQTNYDISGAYANYKKTQLNLLQNQALATGYKEQVGDELKSQYDTAFATAKVQESSRLQELNQEYQKVINAEENRLLEEGSKLANIEKSIFDFRNVSVDDLETLGYYETIDGETRLTDRGRAFIDETLNSAILTGEGKDATATWFSNYLRTTDEDLYDYYVQNLGTVRETIGGLSPTDMSYNITEHSSVYKDEDTGEFKTKSSLQQRKSYAENAIKEEIINYGLRSRNPDRTYTEDDVRELTLDELVKIASDELDIDYLGDSEQKRTETYEKIVKALESKSAASYRFRYAVRNYVIKKKKGK